MKECTCPPEHSITKLGHCRTCDCPKGNTTMPDIKLSPGCPPKHADGSEHNYNWATYCDNSTSYGVCRCGHDNFTAAMWSDDDFAN